MITIKNAIDRLYKYTDSIDIEEQTIETIIEDHDGCEYELIGYIGKGSNMIVKFSTKPADLENDDYNEIYYDVFHDNLKQALNFIFHKK